MSDITKMFFIFLKIGTFTLGGGYAMISLIEEEMVEKYKWIHKEEFLDIIALAQSIPGALVINSATYIGYRLFGFWGAVVGCLSVMLPSVIIILLIAAFFMRFQSLEIIQNIFKGIRPAVTALIVVAVLKLGKSLPKTVLNLFWIFASALMIAVFSVHPIIIIVVSGILGYIFFQEENR